MKNGFLQKAYQKYQRFMIGRNGMDEFTGFLILVALAFSVLSIVPFCWFFAVFPLPIYAYCLFRMLSRNIYKRREERTRFTTLFLKCKSFFKRRKRMFKERKTHKFYKCKKCRAVLRVPKGKGKIEITCPKCQNKITKKT